MFHTKERRCECSGNCRTRTVRHSTQTQSNNAQRQRADLNRQKSNSGSTNSKDICTQHCFSAPCCIEYSTCNDDDRADEIAIWLLETFITCIKKHHTYRDSEPTTSILTITSNVVYGKATGTMPNGRKAGAPLSPGANPAYGAEENGLLASLNSVAKLPYHWALDGISNTQTISPDALGHNEEERINNLVNVLDGYFDQGAHHVNVNVFGTEKLLDAMEHPEKPEYANFTIRVSGYAVKFIDLTREQQLDVIARTCHKSM